MMLSLVKNQSRLQDLLEQDKELSDDIKNTNSIKEKYDIILVRTKIKNEIVKLRTNISIQHFELRSMKMKKLSKEKQMHLDKEAQIYKCVVCDEEKVVWNGVTWECGNCGCLYRKDEFS